MLLLGIETSCDETALALVEFESESKIKLVAEKIASQEEVHEQYGGIVPELAAREHLRSLPVLYDTLLKENDLSIDQVSAIGVTIGPGLKGCLLMGLNFAKALSLAKGIPFLGVNHIEGHLLSPLLDNAELDFPYLCLIASGGHTEIVLAEGLGQYKVVARTLDDAAGEAFDKSAMLLGLGYPGGARLASLGDSVTSSRFDFPIGMPGKAAFSFSGLKTAISQEIQRLKQDIESDSIKRELSFAIQEAIVGALIKKLKLAIKETGCSNVAIAGGVAANNNLRTKVTSLGKGIKVFYPKPIHCTDNAGMIAYVSARRYLSGQVDSQALSVLARWPVEEVCEHAG